MAVTVVAAIVNAVYDRRPALKVVREGSAVAMIEVELGTNPCQTEDYRTQFNVVKAMRGRRKVELYKDLYKKSGVSTK